MPDINGAPKPNPNGGKIGRSPNPKKPKPSMSWLFIGMLFILGSIFFFTEDRPSEQVDWSTFQTLMEKDVYREVTVYSSKSLIQAVVKKDREAELSAYGVQTGQTKSKRPSLLSETVVSTEMPPSATAFNDLYQKLRERPDPISAKVNYVNGGFSIIGILGSLLPLIILIFFWIWMSRSASRMSGGMGGIFNVGKSKAQLFDQDNRVNVTFKDVAGLGEAKQEIAEIVHFLKNPKKYTQLGGKIPKGALLVGPPGTGKTLLAKAVAGEAGVPFFSLSGSDFVEMFVGVGASRVRDLFKNAKEKAPCIIFIDEIDAVGRSRSKNASFGGNDERESTLNQLLTEMDGFGTNSGIIILAATNRADVLDKALLRAGRFDRQINVDLPDVTDRKEIFLVHMRPLKLDDTVDVDLLARQTPGFSGADIANVCNEAALIAARKDKEAISRQDFTDAIDRIVGGLEKKNKITTLAEKKSIAIHEAGHATISWMLEHANPLIKVTIVPRGRALGAAWYLPEERQIITTQQLQDEMCATLGGRAAEEVVLGRISTGASNDLMKVTRMAQAMVTYFGMSDKLPNINYEDSAEGDYTFKKPYSDATAELIDKEVQEIIATQYDRAKQILRDNADGHRRVAQMLFDREVITSEDVENILGKRPWKSRSEELLEAEEARKKREEATETPIALGEDSSISPQTAQDTDTPTNEAGNQETE